MRKNILIYGLILGTVLSANMILMVNLLRTNPDFNSNEILGYTTMVVIFSLIFFGVRNYRNTQSDGLISFGKAFKAGALIALIASTMYVITWIFYYYLIVPDFLEHYIAHVLKETPASEMAAKTQEMNSFKEMYENPFFVVLLTYSEVLPVGLIVALISAFILKKKRKNMATEVL